jgi:hypothetical protein
VDALQDDDNYVRFSAAEALGETCDARAADPLIASLADSDERVRRNAAVALGQIGDKRAGEPLLAALGDSEEGARLAAVGSLGQIRVTRAVEPLVRMLRDGAIDARASAAEALGRIGDGTALESLIAALSDDGRQVVEHAAKAFDGLDWCPGDDETAAVYWLARSKGDRCVALGEPAVEPLIGELRRGSPRAAGALGRIGDPRAVRPPVAVLSSPARERFLWRAAGRALVSIYRSAGLSEVDKRAILAPRGKITERHHDVYEHHDVGGHGCHQDDARYHHDTGLGIDFPL